MELIHVTMNLLVPPVIVMVILITMPPYLIYKLVYFIVASSFYMEDMKGKVVLITGASSGIGEQLVYEYARRGARLVLVARRKNLLEQVANKARGFGSTDVLIVCADVSKVEDCKRFVEEAVHHFGRLDHLVNNAGVASAYAFEEAINIVNFVPVMDVNFWGSIYSTHFAIPHLKKSKGKIVVTASPAGWLPVARNSFYGASKAALINFFETLRVELGSSIKITIVSPGFIESEMTHGKHLSQFGAMEVNQQRIDVLIGSFPVATAEMCAKAMVNGACRGARYITVPSYFGAFFLLKILCPEILDWFSRPKYQHLITT
ncbi:Short-chain dehydrogenase/reductase SDR [Macleaya cordata]|uniref:Short-chain dehydrogenase/reductase SDR n=1 Tax=Macleaya cordata TaxID=56857 RepID=A0A200QGM4_MACCD|nr:Short-chain dehydrogenase/reductase SDR [Macleaya cordata]